MRYRFWCGTALALLPLVLVGHVRAAGNEPKVIALSCDGMVTRTYGVDKPAAPQWLEKSSVIVNLDEGTIFFLGYIVPIEGLDGAMIHFGGRQIVEYDFSVAISGNINRATSRMDATLVMSDPTESPAVNSATIHYDLGCRQEATE
jgi:hypothetical protein